MNWLRRIFNSTSEPKCVPCERDSILFYSFGCDSCQDRLRANYIKSLTNIRDRAMEDAIEKKWEEDNNE